MIKFALYVDDVRDPPEDGTIWVVAREFHTACQILKDNWDRINYVSLDHDLGDVGTATGYDIISWIEREIISGRRSNHFTFNVHSANPSGAARIRQVANKLMEM